MAATVEELTMNYEEDGVLVVEELDKEVLTKGAWATVMYKFRQWDWKKEAYKPPQYSVRRYRKMNGEYRQQSKFTISSDDQARKIVETLSRWAEQGADDAPVEQ